jgi:hypothetical protein
MYIIAARHRIFGFGLTREAARHDLVRRSVHYDGPPLETYPCSPELYRQLQAEASHGSCAEITYRLDSQGVALPAKLGRQTSQ